MKKNHNATLTLTPCGLETIKCVILSWRAKSHRPPLNVINDHKFLQSAYDTCDKHTVTFANNFVSIAENGLVLIKNFKDITEKYIFLDINYLRYLHLHKIAFKMKMHKIIEL